MRRARYEAISTAFRRRELDAIAGEFNLGFWGRPVIVIALGWVLIALGS